MKNNSAYVLFLLASSFLATAMGDVTIESAKLVKPSDTTIDAIIAVKDAADAALAADKSAKVTVMPLPAEDPRADSFNREMPWLANGKPIKWAGPKRTGGDNEDGSHLFRTSRRSDGSTSYWWYERMKEKRDAIRASGGTFDIVMLGDSITHSWDKGAGKSVLPDLRKTYRVLALGYGGDKADTVLWRVRNGELDGYKASVFTLMIGTNNHMPNRDTPERTAKTIGEIIGVIREKQPQAKILLMAIFPRTDPRQGRLRARSLAVSRLIQNYADGENVIWCDFRSLFLKEDGAGRFDRLEDGTHPDGPTGLRVWRDALLPYFAKYTGKTHRPAEQLRKPCARRWIVRTIDVASADDCRTFADFAVRAQYMGYNGICVDGFDNIAAWDKAAKERAADMRELCRDAGLAWVPILKQRDESAFSDMVAQVGGVGHPEAVLIVTNGATSVRRDDLRPAVIREIGVVAQALPNTEVVLFGGAFAGCASGIPATTTMAVKKDFGYFRQAKFPVMLVVDAESKMVHDWNLHEPTQQFMGQYQAQGEKEGILYWTATGDYRMMLDAARLSQHQE